MPWAEQLPSGKYRALYRDRAGKRRSAGTFAHKRAAEKAAVVAEDEARKVGWRDPSAALTSWGQWCDAWWPTRSVSASTAKRDLSPLERHIRPRWHTVPLIDITRQDIRAWTTQLRHDGLAASSVLRYLSVFSASLSAAVEAEILKTNPAVGLKLPPASKGQERYLTDDEYAAVAAELDGIDLAIANFLVGTGARWGEMAGLHSFRIDGRRGMVALVETWDAVSRAIKPYPKGREQREVPLLDWVQATLPVAEAVHSCGQRHLEGRCRSGLVLPAGGGVHDVNNWTKRVWVPAVERAGVGHVRVHDLRHTYASWLLQAGISLAEVGRLLGHKSPITTMRYAHLAETPRALIANAMPAPGVGQTWGDSAPQDAPLRLVRPDVS